MASRLYPGFGRGKGKYEGQFEARSLESAGRADLECGDKVILPQNAFRDIKRLQLPFPLIFHVENARRRKAIAATAIRSNSKTPPFQQFCGVIEFSAPKDKIYMPKWMMKNLKLREGGQAAISTKTDMKKGTFVRFQPHTSAFIDLAASLGPREIMEHAMKHYSALSVRETIYIDCSAQKFLLDVVDVQPDGAALLYGDLDLEVDFMVPKDMQGEQDGEGKEDAKVSTPPRRKREKVSSARQNGSSQTSTHSSRPSLNETENTCGTIRRPSSARRLRDTVAAARAAAAAYADTHLTDIAHRNPPNNKRSSSPIVSPGKPRNHSSKTNIGTLVSEGGVIDSQSLFGAQSPKKGWSGVDLGGTPSPTRETQSQLLNNTTPMQHSWGGGQTLGKSHISPINHTEETIDNSSAMEALRAARIRAAERWRKQQNEISSETPVPNTSQPSTNEAPLASPGKARAGWLMKTSRDRKIQAHSEDTQSTMIRSSFSGTGRALQSPTRNVVSPIQQLRLHDDDVDPEKEGKSPITDGMRLGSGSNQIDTSVASRVYRSRLLGSSENDSAVHETNFRQRQRTPKYFGGTGTLGRTLTDDSESKYASESESKA